MEIKVNVVQTIEHYKIRWYGHVRTMIKERSEKSFWSGVREDGEEGADQE